MSASNRQHKRIICYIVNLDDSGTQSEIYCPKGTVFKTILYVIKYGVVNNTWNILHNLIASAALYIKNIFCFLARNQKYITLHNL